MTRMNSNHSSRLGTALIALVLVAALAAPAAAVSTSTENLPQSAEVGADVGVTFTLTDLYGEYRTWTLVGQSELENVTWTVRTYDSAGDQVGGSETYGSDTFEHGVSANDGIDRVEIRVNGAVPAVENFTYDPPEEFELAAFEQVSEGGSSSDVDRWMVHHYTAESDDARRAMDSSHEAIEEAREVGGDVDGAERVFGNALSAYEAEDFENAIDLADQAEERANDARATTERNRLLLYGGVGLVALALLVGVGYHVYRSRQNTYDRLG